MSSDFPTQHEPPPSNAMGVTGFILSMCGLVCLGLFPIGLIVSLVGLRKEPKGFAIAGTIIGALGTIAMILVVVLYGAMFVACMGFSAAAQKGINTRNAIETASKRIEDYRDENDRLPSKAEGNQLIAGLQDGWDKQLRYEPDEAKDDYLIRSAGEDGTFDTFDDDTSDDYFFEHDFDSTSTDSGDEKNGLPTKTPDDKRKKTDGPAEKANDGSDPDPS